MLGRVVAVTHATWIALFLAVAFAIGMLLLLR